MLNGPRNRSAAALPQAPAHLTLCADPSRYHHAALDRTHRGGGPGVERGVDRSSGWVDRRCTAAPTWTARTRTRTSKCTLTASRWVPLQLPRSCRPSSCPAAAQTCCSPALHRWVTLPAMCFFERAGTGDGRLPRQPWRACHDLLPRGATVLVSGYAEWCVTAGVGALGCVMHGMAG
jgi:hypothetical protein